MGMLALAGVISGAGQEASKGLLNIQNYAMQKGLNEQSANLTHTNRMAELEKERGLTAQMERDLQSQRDTAASGRLQTEIKGRENLASTESFNRSAEAESNQARLENSPEYKARVRGTEAEADFKERAGKLRSDLAEAVKSGDKDQIAKAKKAVETHEAKPWELEHNTMVAVASGLRESAHELTRLMAVQAKQIEGTPEYMSVQKQIERVQGELNAYNARLKELTQAGETEPGKPKPGPAGGAAGAGGGPSIVDPFKPSPETNPTGGGPVKSSSLLKRAGETATDALTPWAVGQKPSFGPNAAAAAVPPASSVATPPEAMTPKLLSKSMTQPQKIAIAKAGEQFTDGQITQSALRDVIRENIEAHYGNNAQAREDAVDNILAQFVESKKQAGRSR